MNIDLDLTAFHFKLNKPIPVVVTEKNLYEAINIDSILDKIIITNDI